MPSPTVVSSAAQAAALVLASEPLFAGIGPLNPQLLGQCCWYEANEAGDAFEVNVELGWGDCQAGCIERHRWQYAVGREGTIALIDESGPQVPDEARPRPGTGPAHVLLSLRAGPTCPVETEPPDPACAPRPVAGAQVVVRTPTGGEAGRGKSDAEGMLALQLPAGAYYLEPQPAEGLLGTAPAVAFSATEGSETRLMLLYDTGIR
ncbi:MAG TPA: hypothetical protein VMP67_03245 [Candidatus Limnocylindria bacterium]|nr:hypothetical protein [Candidatus Limnocylindria bacterium]